MATSNLKLRASNKKLRILIFNWRDIKNPLSGGAEVLTHEMAKRWVRKGHRVTYFSAVFAGCQREETIDGVRVIRRGAPDILSFSIPVHFWAFWFYWTKFRGKFDVVIDEIHGIPFFTPFFVKEKKIVLICEVAKEIWGQMFSFPWNLIGRLVEKFYFRIYKRILFLTISPSTKKDLIKAGIPAKSITILPMGVTLNLPKNLPSKEKNPTFIFVGRLCKMKAVDEAIRAFALIIKNFPRAEFWIVGDGEREYVDYLKKLVSQKELRKNVKFFGFVDEGKKFILLAKAHILLHPSKREGWGLVVHEANSAGTPTVAYNSPGLRDVVKDGKNGILCEENTPQDMSEKLISLLENKSLYQKLQKGGLEEVKKHDWNKTAKVAIEVLDKL
mgnify:CR=1 FL=1